MPASSPDTEEKGIGRGGRGAELRRRGGGRLKKGEKRDQSFCPFKPRQPNKSFLLFLLEKEVLA
jgi:hypothetical protein